MEIFNITIGEYLSRASIKFPDLIALQTLEEDTILTWKELDIITDQIAKGMIISGFKSGDRLVIWASNIKEWVLIFFAASKIGVCTVTLNCNYTSKEFRKIIKLCNPKGIAFMDKHYDVNFTQIIEEIIEKKVVSRKNCIFLGNNECIQKKLYLTIPQLIESSFLLSESIFEEIKNSVNPNDIANIQFTSGTTGEPKGVMLSHKSLVNNSYYTGKCLQINEQDSLCLIVPLFHCFGLSAGLLMCVGQGTTITLTKSCKISNMIKVLEKFKCNILHGVPTMFQRIINNKEVDLKIFKNVDKGLIAGAPVSEKLLIDIIKKIGIKNIQIGYGQTEASPGITQTQICDDFNKKISTVGKPLPFVKVKIVQNVGEFNNKCKLLNDYKVGEICIKGYNVMCGYFNNKKMTEKVLDKDGWLHTGDIGYIDEAGYLHITGRKKELIIRGGENIYPKEIEDAILSIEGIIQSKVVGIDCETYGEEICAFIIKNSKNNINENSIKFYLKEKLAHYKVPKYIFFIDKMPLTTNGKVCLDELKYLANKFINKENLECSCIE